MGVGEEEMTSGGSQGPDFSEGHPIQCTRVRTSLCRWYEQKALLEMTEVSGQCLRREWRLSRLEAGRSHEGTTVANPGEKRA